MHPCREYWGQDVAYGSLVNEERLRRVDRVCALPDIYVLDIDEGLPPAGADADADPARSAHLAGLVKRLCGFDGREETLRQSAAHLKEYLHSARRAACGAGPRLARSGQDVRIVGIASLHRAHALPAVAATGPVGDDDEGDDGAAHPASEQLCAEFLRRLALLGKARNVAQIDWIVVRVVMDAGPAPGARSHIGATKVARVNLQPLAA
jgi:hypothetical protein